MPSMAFSETRIRFHRKNKTPKLAKNPQCPSNHRRMRFVERTRGLRRATFYVLSAATGSCGPHHVSNGGKRSYAFAKDQDSPASVSGDTRPFAENKKTIVVHCSPTEEADRSCPEQARLSKLKNSPCIPNRLTISLLLLAESSSTCARIS